MNLPMQIDYYNLIGPRAVELSRQQSYSSQNMCTPPIISICLSRLENSSTLLPFSLEEFARYCSSYAACR